MMKSSNQNLSHAQKGKRDEFYTSLTDIEKELYHYKEHFNGKVVFCNCDDPMESNFWEYFSQHFRHFGLKKLISTHFNETKPSYKLEKISMEQLPIQTPLIGNGDFRSQECIDILNEADIVVTNPPFSLFREYIAQLVKYDKRFIILGNVNAISYKETFKLIKENKVWLGYTSNGVMEFKVPEDYELYGTSCRIDNKTKYIKVPGISWYTNLDITKRHENIMLYKKYNGHEIEYPKYDNYDAINISKTNEIPKDYNGVMGVPITFMDKYNPEQFQIIGIDRYVENNPNPGKRFTINGKETYARILIKNRMVES